MKRSRRKHDQDLHKLDNRHFDYLMEDDLLDGAGYDKDLDEEEPRSFDVSRWREDLAERTTRRAQMRSRDLRKGLLRDHAPRGFER